MNKRLRSQWWEHCPVSEFEEFLEQLQQNPSLKPEMLNLDADLSKRIYQVVSGSSQPLSEQRIIAYIEESERVTVPLPVLFAHLSMLYHNRRIEKTADHKFKPVRLSKGVGARDHENDDDA